jgi:ribose 1,5-bisphosphokinase PhnN
MNKLTKDVGTSMQCNAVLLANVKEQIIDEYRRKWMNLKVIILSEKRQVPPNRT